MPVFTDENAIMMLSVQLQSPLSLQFLSFCQSLDRRPAYVLRGIVRDYFAGTRTLAPSVGRVNSNGLKRGDHTMIISADLPDEVAAKLDALIVNTEPPAWPFKTKIIKRDALSPADREKLDKYIADYAAYEHTQRDGNALKSRSAVVRKILIEYFSGNHNATESR